MRQRKSKVWDHIEALGLLERGTEAEILAAKRAYRKSYLTTQKQKQRSCKPTFSVGLSKDSGEYDLIIDRAKKHGVPVSAFIKDSAIAYLRQNFLVPKSWQMHRLHGALSDCLNEVKAIAGQNSRFFFDREDKVNKIEKTIIRLDQEIRIIFTEPQLQK